ncbi:MAG: hypothetical protein RLZZ258_1000 [Actinomycetota bacterium]|jgi:hypothetical protein
MAKRQNLVLRVLKYIASMFKASGKVLLKGEASDAGGAVASVAMSINPGGTGGSAGTGSSAGPGSAS